jgi:glucose/arabinose dehydrogenase
MNLAGLRLRHLLVLIAFAVPAPADAREIKTHRIVGPGILDRPVFLTAPPNDVQRVFIVEQHTGEIRILNLADLVVDPTPFLAISNLATGSEQGLLGLAFHPAYDENGLFYVDYTRAGGDTVIAQYATSSDPDRALADETVLLTIDQPQSNHNGGWIGFGPTDGYLYISTGDGGAGNDSGPGHTNGTGNSQDLNSLLGKILRIDVNGDDFPNDASRNYGIPETNPFVNIAAGEIWSYGLRHPYRASFDRESGDLYIGDVGQDTREEVDIQPAGEAGHNFGWRLREGTVETPTGSVGGEAPGATEPIFDYPHGGGGFAGSAVIGGVVYRGPITSLRGRYFFSDFVAGRLWSLRFDGSDSSQFDGTNFTELTDHTLTGDPRFAPDVGSLNPISSFGEDSYGNLYLTKLGSSIDDPPPNTGEIFRVPEPSSRARQLGAILTIAVLRAARFRRGRQLRAETETDAMEHPAQPRQFQALS